MARNFTPLVDRFWSRVDRQGPDDCWLWLGKLKENGYGAIGSGGRNGRSIYVHRLSYDLAHPDDPLSGNLNACHTCDIRWPDWTYRRCVNPAHLFKGTTADNLADMRAKGREARGDRHGMRLHPERHGSITHPESRPRGSSHWLSKLTEEKVRELRLRNKPLDGSKGESGASIARELNMDRGTINAMLKGKTWAHVK